jgi:hypothetical protein
MSGYLDNLVARSLKLTEVIQPRPSSRFEPPSAVLGAASAQHIAAEPRDETSASGEADLSLQTPVQTLTRLAVEPSRDAGPSVAELRRTLLDTPHQPAEGLSTTPAQPLVDPTRQQPPLPAHDPFPADRMGSARSPAQNSLDPGQVAPLQTPPSLVRPSMAQPLPRSAPHPEINRSTQALAPDEDGMGAAWSRGAIEEEDRPTLESAPQPIVIERIALRQEP